MTPTAVKERPILFSGPMVRAILDGKKTQTRRVVNPQPPKWVDRFSISLNPNFWIPSGPYLKDPSGFLSGKPVKSRLNGSPIRCPFGIPGDRLWVRETFFIDDIHYIGCPLPKKRPRELEDWQIYYRADGECCQQIPECSCAEVGPTPWRPSIHMPRWVSRLSLELAGVNVQFIRDISKADALAEGRSLSRGDERGYFPETWDSLNAKRGFGWKENPWVWVIEFKVLEGKASHDRD